MHFVFYVRGVQHQVDLWKALAQSQYWKFDRINLKTKKIETKLLQGGLRPTLLGAYEYIFPEECLSEVLACFGITEELVKQYSTRFWGLRKIFGTKAIPKKNLKEAKDIVPVMIINGTNRGLSSLSSWGSCQDLQEQ